MSAARPFGAVVVAGGAARRFGGIDKLRVEVDGVAVLARVLAAVRALDPADLVVVGPARPGLDDGCRVVREEPVGAGPAAALAAGMAALVVPAGAAVLVLAGDLPHLTEAALRTLLDHLEAQPALDAVAACDADGRRQHLLAAWRRESLLDALEVLGDPVGRAVAALGDGRQVAELDLTTSGGGAPPWQDLDVPPGSAPAGGS